MKNGILFQNALKFGVRACYLLLKGFAIALYEFLEEDPSHPSASTILAPIESAPAQYTFEVGGTLERQAFETMLGNGLVVEDFSEAQGDRSLDVVFTPVQTDGVLDWAVSTGFLRVEAAKPGMGKAAEAHSPPISNLPGVTVRVISLLTY